MSKNLIWIVGICGALAVVFAHASSSTSISAGAISTIEASSRIGSSVKVEGTVSEVHVSRGGTVFVDLDGAYPDETFTAVVFPDAVASVGDLTTFEGQRVDVSGTVQMYRGRPEIIVSSREQIAVAP